MEKGKKIHDSGRSTPSAVEDAFKSHTETTQEMMQSLGAAGQSAQLWLVPPGQRPDKAPTSVSLSDQGLVQVLEAAVTGLEPGKPYPLALSTDPSGAGELEPVQG